MKKLLLAAVAVAALNVSAHAAVIQNLGVNPTSATGDFSNSVGGAVFADQYTFQLVGLGDTFITFASATNVFTNPTDFISNFTGQLFEQVGAVGGGDDIAVSGPVGAVPCPSGGSFCQVLAGAALLDAGAYYLSISGIGGGTSGYGGNLTTAAIAPVPIPAMGAGIPALVMAGAWLARRRRKAVNATV
jgi:hypothetical protein